MIETILAVLCGIAVTYVLFQAWNKYSLRYNHRILQNSKCKNCSEVLGDKALGDALKELEKEKVQLKHEAKIGTIKLHNMALICPNCGTKNYERDLYKANQGNRKKKLE